LEAVFKLLLTDKEQLSFSYVSLYTYNLQTVGHICFNKAYKFLLPTLKYKIISYFINKDMLTLSEKLFIFFSLAQVTLSTTSHQYKHYIIIFIHTVYENFYLPIEYQYTGNALIK